MLRSPGRIAGFAKLMSIPKKHNSSTGPILHLKWQKEQHCEHLWLCMLTHRHHNMTNIKNFHTEMQLKPAPSRQQLSGLRGIHFKREPHSGNGRTVLHPCKPPCMSEDSQTHAAAITLSARATGDKNKCENVNTPGPVTFPFRWIYVPTVEGIYLQCSAIMRDSK